MLSRRGVRWSARAIAIFLLPSCRTPASLDAGDLGSRRPATLMVFAKSNKTFEVAAISGLKEVAERTGGIVDPTPTLAGALAAEFAKAHALALVPLPTDPADYFAPEYGGQPRRGADLLLDVQTTGMSVEPVPWQNGFQSSPFRFSVHFEATMNLIDLRNDDTLVSRGCVGDDPRIARARKATSLEQGRALTAASPTSAELAADGAMRLRRDLDQAVARCLTDLRSNGLQLPAEP